MAHLQRIKVHQILQQHMPTATGIRVAAVTPQHMVRCLRVGTVINLNSNGHQTGLSLEAEKLFVGYLQEVR